MVGTPRCVGTCLASPEGRRRLAGGANHRLGHSMGLEPRPGRPNNNARFPTPFQGLGLTFAINRWFAPPANLPRPSGTLNTYRRSALGTPRTALDVVRCSLMRQASIGAHLRGRRRYVFSVPGG